MKPQTSKPRPKAPESLVSVPMKFDEAMKALMQVKPLHKMNEKTKLVPAHPQYHKKVSGLGEWRIEYVHQTRRWHLTFQAEGDSPRVVVNYYLTAKKAASAAATHELSRQWMDQGKITKRDYSLSQWEVKHGKEPEEWSRLP